MSKSLIAMAMFVLVAGLNFSCGSQQPGQWSYVNASKYNFIEIPADQAYTRAYEMLSQKCTVLEDDAVNFTLVVKQFESPATVVFEPLTDDSCRYTVYSKNSLGVPRKITVQNIYNELERAFQQIR